MITSKGRYFWSALLLLLVADFTTKDLVVRRLEPAPATISVIDSLVRLTLIHNPGTAFGFDPQPYLGSWTRPMLTIGMLAMVSVIIRVYRNAAPQARLAAVALGLCCGGALGNIADRVRFSRGVVDFIDVGIGVHRFWTFNVADAGISTGAVLLLFLLMREDAADASSRLFPAVSKRPSAQLSQD